MIDGIVWYNESRRASGYAGALRSTHRDIPKLADSSGNVYGGIVRHIRANRDGNLLAAPRQRQ